MRLSSIKTISKEDMARRGEVPKWIDPMIETLNTFIDQVTRALSGNLTFEDNFLCKVIEQEFTHATELVVSPRPEGRNGLRPWGVQVEYASGEQVDSLTWRILDTGNIGVTIGFGSSVTAKCKLLILLR